MRFILIVVFVIGFIAVSIYFIGIVLPFSFVDRDKIVNESNCRDEKMSKEECMSGLLRRKIRDSKSHMWKTIEYADENGQHQSLIFRNDRSGAYEFIQPGDSVSKPCGSLVIQIVRRGEKTTYKLKYECDQVMN